MTIAQPRRSPTGPLVRRRGAWGQAGSGCRPEQASRPGLTSRWTWASEPSSTRLPGVTSRAGAPSAAAAPMLSSLRRKAQLRRHERDVDRLGIALGIFAIAGILAAARA